MCLTYLAFLFATPSNAAPEVCNGVDDDGDGDADEAPLTWFADSDGDGSGDPATVSHTQDCNIPAGWVSDDSDCDDLLSTVEPGDAETLDGSDNDCDGSIDENVSAPGNCEWLTDGDSRYLACHTDTDWTTASNNCASWGYHLATINNTSENDFFYWELPYDFTDSWWIGLWDATASGAWVWEDGDPSGYRRWSSGEPNNPNTEDCVEFLWDDGYWNNLRCSDPRPYACETECTPRTTYPDDDNDGFGDPNDTQTECEASAGRVYNAADCDDDDAGITVEMWFADADGDGYGSPDVVSFQCDAPQDYVSNDDDCEDGDPLRNPETEWHHDADSDGFGDPEISGIGCEIQGEVYDDTDCNDNDSNVHPNADEVCGGADEDCDELVDEDDDDVIGMISYYEDGDGDGYGRGSLKEACDPPDPWASQPGDCDDEDEFTYPGAPELCDELDNDCDDDIDEEVVDQTWYTDADGDGYGTLLGAEPVIDCIPPEGSWSNNAEDCDDADSSIHPGSEDIDGDGVDQDCDGSDGSTSTGSTLSGSRDLQQPSFDGTVVGCGCNGPAGPGPSWVGLALALGLRRRR